MERNPVGGRKTARKKRQKGRNGQDDTRKEKKRDTRGGGEEGKTEKKRERRIQERKVDQRDRESKRE